MRGWFAPAREYKTKGQVHNAFGFICGSAEPRFTAGLHEHAVTDKLYDEAQGPATPDLPAEGKTVDLVSGATK